MAQQIFFDMECAEAPVLAGMEHCEVGKTYEAILTLRRRGDCSIRLSNSEPFRSFNHGTKHIQRYFRLPEEILKTIEERKYVE